MMIASVLDLRLSRKTANTFYTNKKRNDVAVGMRNMDFIFQCSTSIELLFKANAANDQPCFDLRVTWPPPEVMERGRGVLLILLLLRSRAAPR